MTEAPTGRPRGRPRDPDADAAILAAALDLFIERGVEGTSIEQVAKRAGVGKLTVYRRWSNKEELIAAAIESARDDHPDPRMPADGSLVELVRAAIPVLAERVVDPRFRAMVARVLGTSSSHPAIMAAYWEHYGRPRRAAIRALLDRARSDGLLPEHADLDVVMDMMVGALMYRLAQPGTLDATEMRRYLQALFVQVGLLRP
ncbi:TetR/AcrR family transcriptional regulator [Pseudonocardia sp. DLS-67]